MQHSHSTRPRKNPETTNPIRQVGSIKSATRCSPRCQKTGAAEQMLRAVMTVNKRNQPKLNSSDDQILDIAILRKRTIPQKQKRVTLRIDKASHASPTTDKEEEELQSVLVKSRWVLDQRLKRRKCMYLESHADSASESTPRNHGNLDGKT